MKEGAVMLIVSFLIRFFNNFSHLKYTVMPITISTAGIIETKITVCCAARTNHK